MPHIGGSDPAFESNVPTITVNTHFKPYAVARSKKRTDHGYERILVVGETAHTSGTVCCFGRTTHEVLYVPEDASYDSESDNLAREMPSKEFYANFVIERFYRGEGIKLKNFQRSGFELKNVGKQ